MHKLDNGITMHNPKKCIGCRYCMINCPYGVIYFNWKDAHPSWRAKNSLIKGVTSSPSDEVGKINAKGIPYYNPERDGTLPGLRPKGVVEKCTFCDHRIQKEQLPRCVEACPTDARIFGDLNDPQSQVNQLLGKFRPFRLKEAVGTEPAVYYIRDFSAADYPRTKGGI
jgi:molybdopterin-containing oxidoreductase family iron-sulfur binding subunit